MKNQETNIKPNKRSGLSRSARVKLLMPIGYCLLSILFFICMLSTTVIQPHHIVGIVLTLIAYGFWIVARIQLGDSFTIAPKAKQLVTTGLYGKFRHPVYYFSFLAVIGLAIFSWSIYTLALLPVLAAVQLQRIRKEEAALQRRFGEEYVRYKKSSWL